MATFATIFLTILTLGLLIETGLAQRHIRHIRRHRNTVPPAFTGHIDIAEHQRAADYTITNTVFGILELFYNTTILLVFTLGGGLDYIDQTVSAWALDPLVHGVIFILLTLALFSLAEIPLALYETFVIESRFGFNRTTLNLFILDHFKEAILLILIGAPLAAAILWFMLHSGEWWWLFAWSAWCVFVFFMMWAFPAFIAPLFNRFTPLANDTVQQRIDALLERCGFKHYRVYVMDGSRRSNHGNAYFTGVGANKRIVFYDTLLKSLSPEEIEAVLAHELGHFKLKHITKRLWWTVGMSFGALALLGWLSVQSWFYSGLGVHQASPHAALMLFMLCLPLVSRLIRPLMTFTARKHEFEADDFASQHSDPQHLIDALVKLYGENANTLTPDPWYSAYHDTHPPAPIRVANLATKMSPAAG
ncbi:MAG: M48 family metallopeptidase [Pseudomonadota bacterium]